MIVLDRAALVCGSDRDPRDLRYRLDDDEWSLVFCAMAALDASPTAEYLDVEQMFPGAVRAIADEASPR